MQNTGYQRIIGSLEKVSCSPHTSQGVSFHVAYMHASMPKYIWTHMKWIRALCSVRSRLSSLFTSCRLHGCIVTKYEAVFFLKTSASPVCRLLSSPLQVYHLSAFSRCGSVLTLLPLLCKVNLQDDACQLVFLTTAWFSQDVLVACVQPERHPADQHWNRGTGWCPLPTLGLRLPNHANRRPVRRVSSRVQCSHTRGNQARGCSYYKGGIFIQIANWRKEAHDLQRQDPNHNNQFYCCLLFTALLYCFL